MKGKVSEMRTKNESFKELKLKLKHSPKQTFIEIDNILSSVQDKKAFVFLMDAHETEKEITREILESLIEKTMEFNDDFLDIIEITGKTFDLKSLVLDLFAPKNIKSLLIAAVVIGVLISIATNESVAVRIIDYVVPPKSFQKEEK